MSQLHAILIGHLDALYRLYGEARGVRIARKHIGWFLRRRGFTSSQLVQMLQTDSAERQLQLVHSQFDGRPPTSNAA